jgi:D-serine deaminase-like pyridoxal phosphate-dependent protein
MKKDDEWYLITNINEVDSPALVIYPQRVKQNIELLKAMIDDVERLRPHIKTHKTREAALLLMEAGINRFKCATIAEAEMLASIKAPDVLLAYQPVGPKADRFISLVQHYPATKFSCLVDTITAARDLSQKAAGQVKIPVYIDLNIGMNRTGIKPGSEAIEVYRQSAQLPGIVPIGLHAYDGHIHDEDLEKRKQKCDEAFAFVEAMKEELTKNGFPEPMIIAGGSPTFPIHAKRKKVECSPGTFIYWDAGYLKGLPEQPFVPAALVISRIISLPNETTICTDLGHKSIAAENLLNKRVTFLNAPELEPIGHSEEHLTLKAENGHHYQVGDVLYGLPYHICPTCALYERAFLVEEGKMDGEWKIVARDRKLCR